MPKEYRTIPEVAGPLRLVRGVENVAYDEMAEKLAQMFVDNAEKRLTTMAPEIRAAGPKPIMGK